MKHALAGVAGLLSMVCVVPYVRDVRRGTTRPQRISWLTFALLAATAATAQIADGATAGAVLGVGAALGFSYVFALSIRAGVGGRSRGDIAGLTLVVASVVLWAVTDRPLLALGGVIVAELAAGLLTVRKAVADPGSETISTWLLDGSAGGLALLASDLARPAEVLYPLNHLAVNAAVALAIVAGRRRPAAVVCA